ncbi:hypothetical protein CFP65_4132 [Kitasatospora sp. MMS16-BH015]|uniref:hypothetical protein n=1 Tax=Kitasatospora sp. MMS16-BH015 TaxID=2018025 RepID=UPI000CA273B1|nr:hypothetical protein [Kitasatospora sp. MMS16-BH015]AUG78887.1 hypothetical protein CFP65_4132 [Kitasatospora sp. MMS16-BH015]
MSIDQDWRFAELIVRALTEPGLRRRYEENPYRVLAEAGIGTTPGEAVPALPAAEELDLVVDLFDRLPAVAPGPASYCLTFNETEYTAALSGAAA